MAHIQRINGKYQARFRGPDRKEHAKRFARKVDAEKWLAEQETEKHRGTWIDPRHGLTLFADWVDEWRATTAALRPSTRARDESYLRTHILPAFGSAPVGAIEHMAVRRWIAEMTAAGKAPATVQKAHQIMSKVMASAVDARLIAASPCLKVKLPRIEREEMRFLSPDEIARLAGTIHPMYRALVLLGAYSGLRIGEMAGLKRARVDQLRRRVDVAEIVTEVQGHLVWGQPKTRAGRRQVPLPGPIMDELTGHLERWAGPELVFTAPEGGPLRVNAWRRRQWAPAVAAADLAPLRVHDLRHTAVALWIATGSRELEVSRRAGHTSTSFTQDRYGHLFPSAEDDFAERLARLVAPMPELADVLPIRAAEG
ncbi:MAG TPA: site-specific integrase [Acidimicrobiales bacterium]|nr:site-specific integrase [Acidimicrobiales bacterium]